MKIKKFIIAGLVFIGLILTSCNNSDPTDNYTSFATTVKSSSNTNTIDIFKLDGGALVNPVNLKTSVEAGKRIILDYYKTKDQTNLNGADFNVYVTGYKWLLTKDVVKLTIENEKEIGDDSFFTLYGIGISGGYMNISVSILYSGVHHYINLVDNTINGEQVIVDTVKLELRQNAFGYNQGFPLFNIVSFNLNQYKILAQSMNKPSLVFNIQIKLIDGGVKKYDVVYNIDDVVQNEKSNPLIKSVDDNIFK